MNAITDAYANANVTCEPTSLYLTSIETVTLMVCVNIKKSGDFDVNAKKSGNFDVSVKKNVDIDNLC